MRVQLMVLAAWWVLGAGCSMDFLAERLVLPPNGNNGKMAGAATAPASRPAELTERRVDFTVGPPAATLATWILEPKGPARGTVLVLHGFLGSHHQVENVARALRDEGYRAVLVDLRGHGKSTGQYITFGVDDAQDLANLTTQLQGRGLCGPTVGVYGTSYGAASGILFAGSDPRVAAVVAVAPFASLREEAPHFGRTLLPLPGDFLSDAQYTVILDKAGKIAQFNPDDANPAAAITRTHAPILLIHGDQDAIIPVQASRELHAAAPDHTELDIIAGGGHLGLSWDPLGRLQARTRTWFDRNLATTAAAVNQVQPERKQ